jgi:hypothetical protein
MNCEDLEGRGRELTEVLSRHLPGGTEGNREKPVMKASAPAKIQTKHLLNRSLQRCS